MNNQQNLGNEILTAAVLSALFALCPTETFFNNNGLSEVLFVNSNAGTFSDSPQLLYSKLKVVLGKNTLRQFAFTIIKPLHQPTAKTKSSRNILSTQTFLLRQYLVKFKLIYKSYFLSKAKNLHKAPTEKALNTIAIEALVLLVGA
jgi:hypothetical protein|tara:strand:+ start:3300 stop:3737 length:438 start_codon:yes stop_codon:yes gene_type:complete